jgi:hypothetical protein
MWRSFAWREALHIHSPRQVEKFVLRETLDAEGFRCAFGEDQNEVRQIIFFKVTITGEEEIFLPTPVAGKMLRRGRVLPSFYLPRSRCQVGISKIEGIPRLRASRKESRQSP